MPKLLIIDGKEEKILRSKDYNLVYVKKTGFMARWGKTEKDDPEFCPFGPEILDIEISVNGCPNKCPFCYKDNKIDGPVNMSFEDFKKIFDKIPKTLTQIAFGITGVKTNPDFMKIMKYTRDNGVTPNFTTTGTDIDDEFIDESSKIIGTLAVSIGEHNWDVAVDTIRKYSDRGIKPNVHLMISRETAEFVKTTIRKLKDEGVPVNAVVLLRLKPKGRAVNNFHQIDKDQFKEIIDLTKECSFEIGFDSCSSPLYIEYAKKYESTHFDELIKMVEPCESSLFSGYINVKGEYWNCSFAEGTDCCEPVNVLEINDFLRDVWYSPKIVSFRNRSISSKDKNGCRTCIVYDLDGDE